MSSLAGPRETVGMDELRRHLGRWLDRVESEGLTIIVTRYGKPVAALVPVDWPGLALI